MAIFLVPICSLWGWYKSQRREGGMFVYTGSILSFR